MRKRILTIFSMILISMILIILSGCSSNKDFNFKKNWTWQELSEYSNNEETIKFISYLKKQITLEDAHFIFNEIKKIKKPQDMLKFKEIEQNQINIGGSFNDIIPNFFTNSQNIPIPDNFENSIKVAFYFTKIKIAVNKMLYTSRLMYNMKFNNNLLKNVDRGESNLDLTINTIIIDEILDLYKNDKIDEKKLIKICNNNIFTNMLIQRNITHKSKNPLATNSNISEFIKLSSNQDPHYKIWNWINPCNNFGFSELYNNREKYQHLINYIKENEQIFIDRILIKFDKYVPKDFTYEEEIQFGVNFGVRSWATDDAIGLNIIHVKDDFKEINSVIRREFFKKIHTKLCIKSPDLKDTQPFSYDDLKYWNFKNKSDQEYYKILSSIYQIGTTFYIGGLPLGFDYIAQLKDSNGFLEQIQQFIYSNSKKNSKLLESTLNYTMEKNGPFYGLGYFMAKSIEKEFGIDEMAKCLRNGPVYFFSKYFEFQNTKRAKKYFRLDKNVSEKIQKLYNIQSQYFKD